MSTQHTQGPWFPVFNGTYWEIRTVEASNEGTPIGDACCSSFIDVDLSADESARNHAQGEINARLMAAAPDLLAAINEALEFVEAQEDSRDGPEGEPLPNRAMQLAEVLRAASAKATGSAA